MNRGWQESGTRGGNCRSCRNSRDHRDGEDARASAGACRRAGYTLIELVSVAALAVILIGLLVGGYHLWTRDTAVDAARRQVQSSLARARAFALARGVETRFVASNAQDRCFTVLDYRATPTNDVWVSLAATNPLPKYVYLDMDAIGENSGLDDDVTLLRFHPDGTLLWDNTLYQADFRDDAYLRVNLYHKRAEDIPGDARYHRYLDVSRLTGLVREVPPGKEDAP